MQIFPFTEHNNHVIGFKLFSATRGQQTQNQVLEFMSRTLVNLPRPMGIYECSLAHMGGEHFVVVLKLEDYERFCNALIQEFDREVKQFYTREELDRGYITARDARGQEVRCPIMALSIGVAHTQYRVYARIRVEKRGDEGPAFWAGVSNILRRQDIIEVRPAAKAVKDNNWHLYRLGTITPSAGDYVWCGVLGNPANIGGVWLDYFELRAVQETKARGQRRRR